MPPELAQWIPPAVIVGVMLYLHRTMRQDMRRMEARLREDMKELLGEVSDLQDRMGRIERTLDILPQFFLDSGRGSAS